MISVDIISKIVNKSTGKSATMVGGESNVDLSAYLLKEIWEKVWEIKTDEAGNEYIFGKLPVVTQYGVTMYADNETLDIPSIYDGLPIDNSTLVWKEGVLMVNPDIELGGASSWDELEGKPSWIGASKPVYQYSEIKNTPDLSKYVSSDELKKFVTLDGNETITGEKNFTGGLKVNGIPIDKSQDDVLYIDGNLVVRGGVTMYGENEVDIPTLMDAIAVDATMYNEGGILGVVKASTTKAGAAMFDSNFFSVDDNGLVTLTNAPSSVTTLGSLQNVDVSLDSTATVDRVLYQPAGSAMWTWRELPKDGVVGDYLPLTGGTMTGGVVIAPSASYTTAITNNCTVLKLGSDTSGMNGYNSGLGFNALQRYSSTYLQHLHAWIGLSPCISSAGSELYDLIFATNGSTTVKTSPIERMRIDYNGNVGIGTTSPAYKLDVNGDSRFGSIMLEYNDEINRYGDVLFINHRGTIQGSQGSLRTGNIVMCFNGGHVGIGSRQPERPLVVSNKDAAGIEFSYDSTFGNIITYNRSTGKYLPLSLGASVVNIGYSSVTCSLLVTGGITMYSDIRKKNKLADVELSLSQIANAPLIEHYYLSDQNKTTHVGSIAQYWAGLNDWFCKLDNEGYYTMEIQNAALASAISLARHLERYESKTDKKIRQLKKRISQLEDKIELLKKGA